MSKYPVWWDSTITIFNKYTDPQTKLISWYKTIIDGCFWKNVGNKVNVGNTILESNDIIARIPKQGNYKKPNEWIALPNDQMDSYFTIQQNDIVVNGSVDDVIDEYTKGKRSNDLIAKYKNQGCMVISECLDSTGIGRCMEHYYIKGV